MDKGVNYAIRNLTRGQGVGVNRIEHREDRLHERRVERLLIAGRFTGNHRTGVGFRTGGRQRQHGAHRNGAFDLAAAGLQDMPWIDALGVVGSGCDKFGAIQH